MGLNAGSSVPEGGCSFTFMTCGRRADRHSQLWSPSPWPRNQASSPPRALPWDSVLWLPLPPAPQPRRETLSLPVLKTAGCPPHPSPVTKGRGVPVRPSVTLGTADWKTILRMGWGAVLSMDTTTTNTSARPGSGSRAKWKRTRKPCWSYTVTGKMLPVGRRGDDEWAEPKRPCWAPQWLNPSPKPACTGGSSALACGGAGGPRGGAPAGSHAGVKGLGSLVLHSLWPATPLL